MTARVDVCAIDIEDDWDDIMSVIEEATYSRIPVYEGSIDNIIGVLYLNHFLKAMTDNGRADIRKLLMKPLLCLQDHEAACGAQSAAQGEAAPRHSLR